MIERLRPALERFRTPLERIGLPAWFVAVDVLWIAKPDVLGIDATHYQRAATAWLAGGDPWKVTEAGVGFAAPPHTLLFYGATSVLSPILSQLLWMTLGIAASIWLVRRLQLPLWWFLFPPLFHATWNGNPQSIVLALLVAGGTTAAVLAVGLKLYGAVALVFRPRDLIVSGVVLAIILPFLPWTTYLQDAPVIAASLAQTWNGSAWRFPLLIPPTLVALWILRRDGAEWLAVPAVWPATEFYFAGMALPAIRGRQVLAAALALPAPLIAPIAVLGLASVQVLQDRRRRSDLAPQR